MLTGCILFFGYTDFTDRMKAASLQEALGQKGYAARHVDPALYGRKICEILAEISGDIPREELRDASGGTLEEPFILFTGLGGEALDDALAICRGQTRAVLTPSNTLMTPADLSGHLAEEKRRFANRRP